MHNNTYSIQPLLPPRLDSSPEQYQAYLDSYQLYVGTIQGIRERAKAASQAKPKPAAKAPERTPPALSEATRQKIGKAYSAGVKFGTLEFSAEEITAARKRWQVLNDRGRTRSSLPLNKKERNEYNEAKRLAGLQVQHQEEARFYSETLTPFLQKMERDVGEEITTYTVHGGVRIPDLTAKEYQKASVTVQRDVQKQRMKKILGGLAAVTEKVKSAKSDVTTMAKAKVHAEIELKRQEAKLRAAQTATQLNRASLRHTVNRSTKSHVVSNEHGEPFVVVVPEISDTTESLLETESASAIQSNLLAEPSRASVLSLRSDQPVVKKVIL